MKVVAVEGPDYSGKSRLVGIIKEKALEAGWDVVVQGFPTNQGEGAVARKKIAAGDTPSVIAHHLENDFRDFATWAVENVKGEDKTLIIMDRFVISTYSHQSHTVDLSYGEYLIPDVLAVMTLDYEVMIERVKEREGDNWDEAETDKYKSPLKWAELSNRYKEGAEHYSRWLNDIIYADGVDDKDDLAEDVLKTAGVIV